MPGQVFFYLFIFLIQKRRTEVLSLNQECASLQINNISEVAFFFLKCRVKTEIHLKQVLFYFRSSLVGICYICCDMALILVIILSD